MNLSRLTTDGVRMPRHARIPAAPVTDGRHHAAPRRGRTARTGLLASAGALTVGAVAVATGLLPSPPGLPNGGVFATGGDDADTALAGPSAARPQTSRTAVASPQTTSAPASHPAPSASTSSGRSSTAPVTPTQSRRPTTTKTAPSPAPSSASGAGTSSAVYQAQTAVIDLVNQERAQVGCQAVRSDDELTDLAQAFSVDMAKRDFFDHTDPDGDTPWDRAEDAGIDYLGGENIALGQASAQAVMDSWMNSPGHRANILNCDYHTIGVGAYFADGGPWWTQDFGF